MKIRIGFISNSSTTSYVILDCDNYSDFIEDLFKCESEYELKKSFTDIYMNLTYDHNDVPVLTIHFEFMSLMNRYIERVDKKYQVIRKSEFYK